MNRLHASTVAIAGRAVLITGPSGTGKSDLALRLIAQGAILVADDYTDLEAQGGALIASPPATIAGKIEVRGVGIQRLPYLVAAPVALLVSLKAPAERLPEPVSTTLEGLSIPVLALAPHELSAPAKIFAALRNLPARGPVGA